MGRTSVDDRVLRDIADEWRGLNWVTSIRVRPRNKSNKVVVELEANYYPSEVRQVSVEFEVLVDGDFFVTYREVRERKADECRWDRHAKFEDRRRD